MIIQIRDEHDEVIWSRGEKSGVTSLSHRKDGSIDLIIEALSNAVLYARAERDASGEDNADVAKLNSENVEALLNR